MIPEETLCKICSGVLKKPYLFKCCSEEICKRCYLTQIIKSSEIICPFCKELEPAIILDEVGGLLMTSIFNDFKAEEQPTTQSS